MIGKILRSDCIVLDKQLQTKKDVINYMANHLYHGNYINNKEKFINVKKNHQLIWVI